MKLLFDENLSHTLVEILLREFPGSSHVRASGLLGADDEKIWAHARDHGLTIVSIDTDFRERSYVEGSPPKTIWLDVGNAGTAAVAELLRREHQRMERFAGEEDTALLILSIADRAV